MFKPISDFASTAIVPANSHGPYDVIGGSPILLSAGVPHADCTYAWEFGDGATASTPSVIHRYGRAGTYIAKLTVTVNQPGGAVTRHFAIINVRNTPPVVDAGAPKTVDEGTVTQFIGTFTDAQWLDTHTARWDWGDTLPSTDGVVAETHAEPAGTGTVTASHAWGDSGDFTVTLTVTDDQGGVGFASVPVKVLNVPPRVDAGRPMFAYPCSVITLRGKFTDPGWLDKHIGFWDFGDCQGDQRAVINERNDPPEARGEAVASHVYHRCGLYTATCTVIDDDLGVGRDATTITVVDVLNKTFEQGFHGDLHGSVANAWTAYRRGLPQLPPGSEGSLPAGASIFAAEEFLVHEGQRAQRIHFEGPGRAGILQLVGANPKWEYQITAWYSLHPQSGGDAYLTFDADEVTPDGAATRLGVDPEGETQPSSTSVVWMEGRLRGEWAQLVVRTIARADRITIFLEGFGDDRLPTDVVFDHVELIAIQPFCPEEKPREPEDPREPETVCVDFADEKPGERPATWEKGGFTFQTTGQRPNLIVVWGAPTGQGKLLIVQIERVRLPFPSSRVEVTMSGLPGAASAVEIIALDANGAPVASQTSTGPGVETIVLTGARIVEVVVTKGRESLLVRVCATRDETSDPATGRPRRSAKPAELVAVSGSRRRALGIGGRRAR